MVLKWYLLVTLIAVFANGAPSDLIINFYGNGCTSGSCNENAKNPSGINGISKPLPGYEKFDTSYYKYHREPQLFHQARTICEAEGAYITVINSEAEASFLVGMMNRYPASVLNDVPHKDYILIGFHDFFKEGDYVTIQGQTLAHTGFTRWAPGQPDNAGGNEHCGSLHRSGGLNDFPCPARSPFICEFTPSNCSSTFITQPQQLRIERPRFVKITERSCQLHILTRNYLNYFKEFIIPKSNCTKVIPFLEVNELGISERKFTTTEATPSIPVQTTTEIPTTTQAITTTTRLFDIDIRFGTQNLTKSQDEADQDFIEVPAE